MLHRFEFVYYPAGMVSSFDLKCYRVSKICFLQRQVHDQQVVPQLSTFSRIFVSKQPSGPRSTLSCSSTAPSDLATSLTYLCSVQHAFEVALSLRHLRSFQSFLQMCSCLRFLCVLPNHTYTVVCTTLNMVCKLLLCGSCALLVKIQLHFLSTQYLC